MKTRLEKQNHYSHNSVKQKSSIAWLCSLLRSYKVATKVLGSILVSLESWFSSSFRQQAKVTFLPLWDQGPQVIGDWTPVIGCLQALLQYDDLGLQSQHEKGLSCIACF